MEKWDKLLEQMKTDTSVPENVWEIYTKTLENLPEQTKQRKWKLAAPIKAAIITLCVLALAGGGVYAAGLNKNIAYFLGQTNDRIPEEAEKLLNEEVPIVKTTQDGDDLVDVEVQETLCDTYSLRVLFKVSAKEKDKYLLLPSEAESDGFVETWYPENKSSLRIAEYAKENNLQILLVDAWIEDLVKVSERVTGVGDSVAMEMTADDEMVYMLEIEKPQAMKEGETTIHVSASLYDVDTFTDSERNDTQAEKKETLQQVFSFKDDSSGTKTTYTAEPSKEMEEAGLTIYDVKVYQTEFRAYMFIDYAIQNKECNVEMLCQDKDGQPCNFTDAMWGLDDEQGHRHELVVYDPRDVSDDTIWLGYDIRDYIEDTSIASGKVKLTKNNE